MENSIFKFEKNDTCRMNRAPLVRFLEYKFEETLLFRKRALQKCYKFFFNYKTVIKLKEYGK